MLLTPYLKIKNGSDQLIVEKIKKLIKENKSNVRVEEISDKIGIDRFKLRDIFQRHENMNVRDYISDYRIRLLKDYVQQGYTFNQCCKEMRFSRKTLEKFIKTTFGKDIKSYWEEIRNKETIG